MKARKNAGINGMPSFIIKLFIFIFFNMAICNLVTPGEFLL
jgi:hypothetical protein